MRRGSDREDDPDLVVVARRVDQGDGWLNAPLGGERMQLSPSLFQHVRAVDLREDHVETAIVWGVDVRELTPFEERVAVARLALWQEEPHRTGDGDQTAADDRVGEREESLPHGAIQFGSRVIARLVMRDAVVRRRALPPSRWQ